jgi:hypothetical protein
MSGAQGPLSPALQGRKASSSLAPLAALVQVSAEQSWRAAKAARASDPAKAKLLSEGFGNPISVRLGRQDADAPSPAGRLLTPDASVDEVQRWFSLLGAKPGQGGFGKKPPFWERQQVGAANKRQPGLPTFLAL